MRGGAPVSRRIGDRVMLREYRSEDLSALRAWVNDESTTRYLGSAYRRPQTWEQTEEWLSRRLSGDAGGESFVIADKSTLKYLGQCDLMFVDPVNRKAEIAVLLLPSERGKGYAREALNLLVSYAFDALNLHRIYLKCAAENEPALRLYESLGFEREGILKDDLFIDGRYMDACLLSRLRPVT